MCLQQAASRSSSNSEPPVSPYRTFQEFTLEPPGSQDPMERPGHRFRHSGPRHCRLSTGSDTNFRGIPPVGTLAGPELLGQTRCYSGIWSGFMACPPLGYYPVSIRWIRLDATRLTRYQLTCHNIPALRVNITRPTNCLLHRNSLESLTIFLQARRAQTETIRGSTRMGRRRHSAEAKASPR